MDLASLDEGYRRYSIMQTQRVIDITKALKKYFPTTERPMIVANIGGFTMDKVLPAEQLNDYYERFANSLSLLAMNNGTIPLAFWWATISKFIRACR